MTSNPANIADRVAYGNDGKNFNPPVQDGPVLVELKKMFAQAKVDTRNAYLEAMKIHEQEKLANLPNLVSVQGSGSVPASGTVYIDLGQPQLGRRWLVRMLAVVQSVSPDNTLGGKAYWFVGNYPGGAVRTNPADLEWIMSSLPATQTFTSESIMVMPNQHLWVAIIGGTQGQLATATANVLDYNPSLTSGVPVI